MTIFYQLRHATDNLECYVGSTDNFSSRKRQHKHNCHNPDRPAYNTKVYQYIRANGGFNNWRFDILAEVEALNQVEKLLRERELTEQHGATLNVLKAGALLEVGKKAYNIQRSRQANDTDNLCDRCGATYRGKSHKSHHQRTRKCQQRARQQPPIIVHVHIHMPANN